MVGLNALELRKIGYWKTNREAMNILILNTSELTGGAAVAANRLAKALGKSGVEVSMLVRDRKTDHVKVLLCK